MFLVVCCLVFCLFSFFINTFINKKSHVNKREVGNTMSGLSTYYDKKEQILDDLDGQIPLLDHETVQTDSSEILERKAHESMSAKDFFNALLTSSRLAIATKHPDLCIDAKSDVDTYLSEILLLFVDDTYRRHARMVSSYYIDHLAHIQKQAQKLPFANQDPVDDDAAGKVDSVALYANYRISAEWILVKHGFFGNPSHTLLKNVARQKGTSEGRKLMHLLAKEEYSDRAEAQKKLMDEKDYLSNAQFFLRTALSIAHDMNYHHPDHSCMSYVANTVMQSACILQYARVKYCANDHFGMGDLDLIVDMD